MYFANQFYNQTVMVIFNALVGGKTTTTRISIRSDNCILLLGHLNVYYMVNNCVVKTTTFTSSPIFYVSETCSAAITSKQM